MNNVSSTYALRNKSTFVDDFYIHFGLLWQQVVGNKPSEQVGGKVVDGTVSGMFNLAYILQFVIQREFDEFASFHIKYIDINTELVKENRIHNNSYQSV